MTTRNLREASRGAMPDFSLELDCGADKGRVVIGLDEAGRGPWAGPVVAAAGRLGPEKAARGLFDDLADSKKLTAKRRLELAAMLEEEAEVAVALASAEEIDHHNVLQASLLAMSRAAALLGCSPHTALIDGNKAPKMGCECRPVVKGDDISLSIAAASILAKVRRDAIMGELAALYPHYGWERNQGYGTAEHRAALTRHGVTPEHRRSFRPVFEALQLTL